MTDVRVLKGPNLIDPQQPSAVGSRNSLYRDGRDEYKESESLVNDEVERIMNHVGTSMPKEALEKLDVMAGVKSKLFNYYNINYQNMLNRYLVTVEDELAKRYRDLVDKEEFKQLNQYTPRFVTDLINGLGEGQSFNLASIEKSFASTYEQLQKNINQSVQNLARETQVTFSQRTGAGSFLAANDASKLVQCSFKNNAQKPQTVVDVKLAVNVLDNELVDPIFHYQKPISDLLKEVISNHIHEQIDKEIKSLQASAAQEGNAMGEEEEMKRRFELLEGYLGTNTNPADEADKRYDYVAKKIMDAVDDGSYELPAQEMEAGTIRANVKKVLDQAHVRNRGFNKAVNMLTSILDEAKIGYQYIDNLKNARTCLIKEYHDSDPNELPDETFAIRLTYLDWDQLRAQRQAYETQVDEMEAEVSKVVAVVEKVYKDYCTKQKIKTYQDLADDFLSKEDTLEGETRVWNELVFTDTSRNQEKVETFKDFNLSTKRKIAWMKSKLGEVYKSDFPQERVIIEERIQFLQGQFAEFSAQVNPYHLQQGLLVNMEVTSVKKKGITLKSMSQVLNELLLAVSKQFEDNELNHYHRAKVQEPIEAPVATPA